MLQLAQPPAEEGKRERERGTEKRQNKSNSKILQHPHQLTGDDMHIIIFGGKFANFETLSLLHSGGVPAAKDSGVVGGAAPPTSTGGQETITTAAAGAAETKVSMSGLSGAEVKQKINNKRHNVIIIILSLTCHTHSV